MNSVYLDNNATTQPLPEVVVAMQESLAQSWANPSSTHRPGLAARHEVERARASVATLLGCPEKSVVFTSGATESVVAAILGAWRAHQSVSRSARSSGEVAGGVILVAATEHAAVLGAVETAESLGARAIRVPVGIDGLVDRHVLERLLGAEPVACVSIALANNETGVLQPLAELVPIIRRAAPNTLIHTDATQAVGKVPVDLARLGVDLLSCSAHKFHGPKGVGALAIRPGVVIEPMLPGVQERGRRGGTECVHNIVGMGVAAVAASAAMADPCGCSPLLRDRFESRVIGTLQSRIPSIRVVIHGVASPRLWNTSSIGFEGLEAESIVLALSERGIAIGAGAACASGSLEPSPALLAMGIQESLAHGSVRVSLSRFSTREEIDRCADSLAEVVATLADSSGVLRR
ncbi:MAG: cysteine desulfurase family protein [Planctomycetota bacterium]|nr:cysteine desulfurase family protein [Planctomycetota bacterium]MDA1105495.1 cysteine desulfurase family protein [Planctomycetota bacterium]